MKTSLNLALVCIHGLSCLLSNVETVKKFSYGLQAHKVLKHVESKSLTLASTSWQIVEQFEQRKRMKKVNNFQIVKVQPEDVA